MSTYGIPVMFDVAVIPGHGRAEAAGYLAFVLADRVMPEHMDFVESWWLIDAQDKHADGNDNLPGTVVFNYGEQQACARCGDRVHAVSSDGLCDGCVAADAQAPALKPAESMCLTVARAQVARGEAPDPNVAAVCVAALARLVGQPIPEGTPA